MAETTHDYLVVGGGFAGCAPANRLSAHPARQVLLLEAGRMDRDPLIHIPVECWKYLIAACIMIGAKAADSNRNDEAR